MIDNLDENMGRLDAILERQADLAREYHFRFS